MGCWECRQYKLWPYLFSDNGGENWVRQGADQTALQGIDVNDVWAVDEILFGLLPIKT